MKFLQDQVLRLLWIVDVTRIHFLATVSLIIEGRERVERNADSDGRAPPDPQSALGVSP